MLIFIERLVSGKIAMNAKTKSAFWTDLFKSFFYPDAQENLKYTDTYGFSSALASLKASVRNVVPGKALNISIFLLQEALLQIHHMS